MAYLSLLKSGELTANDVSSATTIPFSKVYIVLEKLEKKDWVEVKGGRPRLSYPRSRAQAPKRRMRIWLSGRSILN